MSLSSFLLPGTNKGKAKVMDKGLDDLFRATAAAAPPARSTVPGPSATAVPAPISEKKRKATEDTRNAKAKRSKSEAAVTASSSKTPVKVVTEVAKAVAESEGEDEEETDASEGEDEEEESSSDSDNEGDPSKLMHESLQKGAQPKGQSRHGKPKFVPSEETPEQRDARTIFVGNVSVGVTKSRPTQKQLKRHILSFVPSAKIESVRFRSVAFKKPTAELPDDNRKTSHAHPNSKPSKPREHDRDRAASWRADTKNADDEGDAAAATSQKQYLTPKEKKRIAFIKHEIHEHVDAVNAYVVFAHSPSAEALAKRPGNVPPPAPVMDPYEAASACAERCDGSAFLGRTLRVDVVKKGARPRKEGEDEAVEEKGIAGDPKATLFVGNLEFTTKEEDLRVFFEGVVSEERGKPSRKASADSEEEEDDEDESEEDEEAKDQPRTWVKRVRIIRDKDTQLGKGFAYVQFMDRECVDEILALDQSKLKFAKRKLRVQRCKTLPGGPKLRVAKPPRASSSSGPGKSSRTGTSPSRPERTPRLIPTRAPKGNPELGAKLAHLPKEERKKVKATDADRVARRLAKKRAKVLADKGVKSKSAGDRERVRKRVGERKEGGQGHGKDKPKKRVRSGKALMKMNTKK